MSGFGPEAIEHLRVTLRGIEPAPAGGGPGPGRRQAAVLVPLFVDGGLVRVVLGKRSASMRQHSGEVAFPGGGRDATDPTLQHTALREAQEEAGIRPGDVDVLGGLHDMPTASSGYVIRPFVGVIPHPYPLAADGVEFERLITPPLAWFDDPGRYRQETWERDGVTYPVHYFDVDGDVVWGATARMLLTLVGLLRGRPVEPPAPIPLPGRATQPPPRLSQP